MTRKTVSQVQHQGGMQVLVSQCPDFTSAEVAFAVC